MSQALFGPAGGSEFFQANYKSSVKMPAYLHSLGLNAFEYQCGRGVNIGQATASALGRQAGEHGIAMSLHAPYFINLSSGESERVEKNIGYIIQAAQAADWMGADRITVHCGGLSGRTRQEAMENTLRTLERALRELEERGLSHVIMCIETMGKQSVMGDFDEVMAICRSDERLLPCIDFGHLNARTQGGMTRPGAFEALLDQMADALGRERASRFHGHFSKIEYNAKGEVRHLCFDDQEYGPEFAPLAALLAGRDLAPRIICESAGTQDRDAAAMKAMYEEAKGAC